MEEKIVAHLIDYYRSHGIDMHFLLDDGYFKSLPFDKRIQYVKKYASDLERGTSEVVSKHDLKRLGTSAGWGALGGAITGAIGGLAARKTFLHGEISPLSVIIPAVVGAGYGVYNRAQQDATSAKQRHDMKTKFKNLRINPSDTNAVDVLVSRALQNSPINKPDNTLAALKVLDLPHTTIFGYMKDQGTSQTKHWNEYFQKTPLDTSN